MLSTVLEWNWTPKDICRITRRHDWLLHGLFHILADWRRFPRSNCISETTLQGKAPPFRTGNWFYSCSLATRSFMWWRVLGAAYMQHHTKLQKKEHIYWPYEPNFANLKSIWPFSALNECIEAPNSLKFGIKPKIWTPPAGIIDNTNQLNGI